MKFSELKGVTLSNRTVLLDVSHVKMMGDELKTDSGFVLGRVEQSEIPTYGYVVAHDQALEGIKVGDIVPIAQAGSLRSFDWPEKSKDQKIVAMRFEAVDGVIEI